MSNRRVISWLLIDYPSITHWCHWSSISYPWIALCSTIKLFLATFLWLKQMIAILLSGHVVIATTSHLVLHCTKNCLYTTPLTYVKGVKGHIWPSLIIFDSSQRPFLTWVKCDTPLTRIKSDRRFCQISLARTPKVPLLTIDSGQRHDNFDASQSYVKAKVKGAPTPLIRVSKILVQLWYTFDTNQSQIFMQCSVPSHYFL